MCIGWIEPQPSKRKPMSFMEAMELERELPSPYASIQWKGTDVCMDVYCDCGAMYHIDGDFVYFVHCGACGRTFYTGRYIRLIEMATHQGEAHTGEAWGFWNEREE